MPVGFRKGSPQQRTRFAPSRVSAAWQKVVSHLTPPSQPSTTSQSAIDSTFNHTDLYYNESLNITVQHLDLLNPKSGTHDRHKRMGFRRKGVKSSQANSNSRTTERAGIPHIVVDADFDHFTPATAKSDSDSNSQTPDASAANTKQAASSGSDLGFSKAEADDDDEEGNRADRSDAQSMRPDRRSTWLQRTAAYEWIFERLWPNIRHFFDSSFPEPSKERSFQKEAWFTQKQGALVSTVFFLISWTLTAALQPKFNTFYDVTYFVVAGTLTVPLVVLVMFDFPRRHPWIWQPWLLGGTWVLADLLIIEMHRCSFFGENPHCGAKNFLNTLGFAFGQPTLAILALRQNRIFASIGAAQWLIIVGALLLSEGAPKLFLRNVINFALFHAFLIGTSFLKERSDRQMFALRQQLKIQYRATQSAQVMERRASDSKKRFVSYIFHEVRVPLNTALLAVQNLEGELVFKGLHDDQEEMVHGLIGSLTMMEKVLNDVLSFNRMESGKFAQARKQFDFHKSIQLVGLSHRMQALMAGIDLIVSLDPDIDKIGGSFVGDEMRLRQVASNLVSNSIKFTESGSVRIVTKLLYPRPEPTPATEIDDPLRQAAENADKIQQIEDRERMERYNLGDIEKGSIIMENRRQSRDLSKDKDDESKRYKAVVRVEIHDTGVGLKKQDVIDNRLFSPYVQTEIGRRQGGKGSGLGLALVRQIVKLSHGRLGVESEFGKGSMFWFELPYSLPPLSRPRTREVSKDITAFGKVTIPQSPANPPLVRIMDPAHRGIIPHRPEMAMTESTMPLIAHGWTISGTQEQMMIPPFPTEVTTSGEAGSSDGILTDITQRPSGERRSSEWSVKPGQGSTTPTMPSASAAPPLPSPGLPLSTLVVDDDRLTRMLMSRMLTRLGHQVTTAENGKVALDMIRDSFEQSPGSPRFEVVFLDNQMPLMSGVEVAREVREMGCPLYIVGCTGNALREDQDEYIAAGADGIIPKPVHQKAVVESIREARRRVAGETAPKDLEPEYGVGSPMTETP